MDAFRQAANSVAMLYKEGLANSKNSFQMGYEQALQDIWQFISISDDGSNESHNVNNNYISKAELVSFLQQRHSESLLDSDTMAKEVQQQQQQQSAHLAVSASSSSSAAPARRQDSFPSSASVLSPKSAVSLVEQSPFSLFSTAASTNNPPSISAFNPSGLPNNLPHLPENLPHVYDSLKRRWGFHQSDDYSNMQQHAQSHAASTHSHQHHFNSNDQQSSFNKRLKRDDDEAM